MFPGQLVESLGQRVVEALLGVGSVQAHHPPLHRRLTEALHDHRTTSLRCHKAYEEPAGGRGRGKHAANKEEATAVGACVLRWRFVCLNIHIND
jgi:hypothetical protein